MAIHAPARLSLGANSRVPGGPALARRPVRACSAAGRAPAENAAGWAPRLASAALAAWCLLTPLPAATAAELETVYFGNGCFWGRQKDFTDVETQQLGRTPEQLTALVGYAAGRPGPDGRVCYVYHPDPRAHYDALGHAEVVRLGVGGEDDMRAFARRYFAQFRTTPAGMQRLDPQDQGAAYRNVVGLPGGVSSPLFRVLQEENVHGMELREGRGNVAERAGPNVEDDRLNVVWVVDSATLPFYQAERWHQFHHGLGKRYPLEYVRDLKEKVASLGRIQPTGCAELPW